MNSKGNFEINLRMDGALSHFPYPPSSEYPFHLGSNRRGSIEPICVSLNSSHRSLCKLYWTPTVITIIAPILKAILRIRWAEPSKIHKTLTVLSGGSGNPSHQQHTAASARVAWYLGIVLLCISISVFTCGFGVYISFIFETLLKV